jgi:hypothetical protein
MSPILLAVVVIMIVLSAAALYQAIIMLINNEELSVSLNFLILGGVGIALSTYLMFQTRRQVRLVSKTQRISTTSTCPKCGFKTVRDFQQGDFVLKDSESCPKCNDKMMIYSIHREVEKKQKKEEKKF